MLAKNWSKTKDSGHKFILQISPSDPLRGIMAYLTLWVASPKYTKFDM